MGVNRQLAEPCEFDHSYEADRIDARHQASGAVPQKRVMPPSHLVEITRQIERIHHLLPRTRGVIVDYAHAPLDTLVKRTSRPIRLQFIVLDEVDAGSAQAVNQLRG